MSDLIPPKEPMAPRPTSVRLLKWLYDRLNQLPGETGYKKNEIVRLLLERMVKLEEEEGFLPQKEPRAPNPTSFRLTKSLLERINRLAKAKGYGRSELVIRLLQEGVERHDAGPDGSKKRNKPSGVR